MVSDLAGILRGLVWHMSWLTLFIVLLVPLATWVLWRTGFGLRLRSCGEHPDAADSLGVNVYLYKYYGVTISGALAGLGGGFLAIQLSGLYREGQTLGKGFIGLATMIFGNWRPGGTAAGSLLFGFTETLRLRDPNAAHALLLLATVSLGLFALFRIYRRRWMSAAVLGGLAVVIGIAYFTTNGVPDQLPKITPYLAVLFVLLFAVRRLRPPAKEGIPWSKGENA